VIKLPFGRAGFAETAPSPLRAGDQPLSFPTPTGLVVVADRSAELPMNTRTVFISPALLTMTDCVLVEMSVPLRDVRSPPSRRVVVLVLVSSRRFLPRLRLLLITIALPGAVVVVVQDTGSWHRCQSLGR
jgi:hypothetical protein